MYLFYGGGEGIKVNFLKRQTFDFKICNCGESTPWCLWVHSLFLIRASPPSSLPWWDSLLFSATGCLEEAFDPGFIKSWSCCFPTRRNGVWNYFPLLEDAANSAGCPQSSGSSQNVVRASLSYSDPLPSIGEKLIFIVILAICFCKRRNGELTGSRWKGGGSFYWCIFLLAAGKHEGIIGRRARKKKRRVIYLVWQVAINQLKKTPTTRNKCKKKGRP